MRVYNNLCLDVKGASTANFTPVQVYPCNGSAAQQWAEKRTSRTSLRALNKCLDVHGAGTTNGTKVGIYDCNGTDAQNWVPRTDGSYALYNPKSNKCLDIPNHSFDPIQVQIWDCTGSDNQKWVQFDNQGNYIPPG